jgi:hypothetical protein
MHDDDVPGAPWRCSCGRVTTSDMARDFTGLAREHRERLPAAMRAETHLCDGCHERLILEGYFTHHELVEALGAPPAVVEAHRRQFGETRRTMAAKRAPL